MKPGYIYVLTHPSDSNLYKIGVTTLEPSQRLKQHNRDFSKIAGSVVEETGQKWELKEYHAVSDMYSAECAFWASTKFADVPYRGGVEVERMSWDEVQRGLVSARRAGVRVDTTPISLPDHVYAYTASMRRRLEGRGISLLGEVKSIVSGKAMFRCDNGHEWRGRALHVAEGQGCPECGIGERTLEEVREAIQAGVVCLLIHPERPDLVRVEAKCGALEQVVQEKEWGDWEVHRYRNVDEVDLAEKLVWEMLGKPLPHDREPIKMELSSAEESFRKLIYVLREEIAHREKRRLAI